MTSTVQWITTGVYTVRKNRSTAHTRMVKNEKFI